MRVIGYVRVSTDNQGISVAAQTEKIHAYCEAYELDLVETFEDFGQSGKNLSRPAITQALDMLACPEIDGLIVTKLDRLTRSVKDLGQLVESNFKKKTLISVTEQLNTSTATGRMIMGFLGLVSQWEREVIGERTAIALQHLKAQGVQLGRLPYGQTRGLVDSTGRREIHTNKSQVITARRISQLNKNGQSLKRIADFLNLHLNEYPTSRGGKWHASTVRNILKKYNSSLAR